MLSKVKIGITKIFVLGGEYEIGGRVRFKPAKIIKILTLPISEN